MGGGDEVAKLVATYESKLAEMTREMEKLKVALGIMTQQTQQKNSSAASRWLGAGSAEANKWWEVNMPSSGSLYPPPKKRAPPEPPTGWKLVSKKSTTRFSGPLRLRAEDWNVAVHSPNSAMDLLADDTAKSLKCVAIVAGNPVDEDEDEQTWKLLREKYGNLQVTLIQVLEKSYLAEGEEIVQDLPVRQGDDTVSRRCRIVPPAGGISPFKGARVTVTGLSKAATEADYEVLVISCERKLGDTTTYDAWGKKGFLGCWPFLPKVGKQLLGAEAKFSSVRRLRRGVLSWMGRRWCSRRRSGQGQQCLG